MRARDQARFEFRVSARRGLSSQILLLCPQAEYVVWQSYTLTLAKGRAELTYLEAATSAAFLEAFLQGQRCQIC